MNLAGSPHAAVSPPMPSRVSDLLARGPGLPKQGSSNPVSSAETSNTTRATSDRLLEWSVALVVVLLPVTWPLSMVGVAEVDGTPRTLTFFPLDLALAAVIVLGVPRLIRTLRRGDVPLPCLLLQVLTVLITVSAVVNPTPSGFQVAFRMTAIVIVVLAMAELGPRLLSGPVVYACLAAGLEQSILAVGQVIAGHGLGFTLLGLGETESPPLIPFGGVPSARGTFFHPYVLAGFAAVMCTVILARVRFYRRRFWQSWFCTAAVAVPLGLTFSRMSLLTVAMFSITLLIVRRERARNAACLAAVLLGVLSAAISTADGWIARGQQTVQAGTAERLTSGRLILLRQAQEIIERSPLFGVGPDNYLKAVGAQNPEFEKVLHVHNVPLLVAAENGLVAGLVLIGLIISLAVFAFRSGAVARCIFCGLLPFLLLDHFAYSRVQGLVLFGIWMGAVIGVGRIEQSSSAHLP